MMRLQVAAAQTKFAARCRIISSRSDKGSSRCTVQVDISLGLRRCNGSIGAIVSSVSCEILCLTFCFVDGFTFLAGNWSALLFVHSLAFILLNSSDRFLWHLVANLLGHLLALFFVHCLLDNGALHFVLHLTLCFID